ncbi:unnamed protein product [Strongylus vulgaris]|uniref:Ig-like domain-containing protein n=1 Tax=Strongylus vulgaris TaxID=40348 RepID=A0A3P7L9K0_STRVU|nr:unnamed protein product [Strongylus vulgaris]
MLLLHDQASANTESCCRKRGVSEVCSRALCRLTSPPGDKEIYTVFEPPTRCDHFLPQIAECIVDGRDSTACCQTNAVQDDESSCLDLCRGSPNGVNHWIRYQSCLSLNLASMYTCILSSHSSTPTPPQLMKIIPKTSTSVELHWSAPAKHPELVHIYKVHLAEISGPRQKSYNDEEVIHSTKQHSISLTNLRPDRSYSVYVVAHASDLSRKSTPSDVLRFSTSLSENDGVSYTSTLYLPREAKKATLACHLRMGIGAKMHMVWEKKQLSTYRRVDGPRFNITTYTSEDRPLILVSSLDIRELDSSDFGTYRCHVSGNRNDFGEVHLVAHSHAIGDPPLNPPETLLECCSRAVYRAHCHSVCHAGSTRTRGLRPGEFLPRNRCLDEFQSLLRCTLSEMNSAGCCIRKNIPYHCLGMCDSNFELTTLSGYKCLEYQNEVYHVYHRKRRGPWKSMSVAKTAARVKNADEIIVLAVNAYGSGSANRIAFEDNEWIGNYD